MSITYPIEFPSDKYVTEFTYYLIQAVGISESPYTFQQQTFEQQGSVWQIEITIETYSREEAEAYNTFLLKLNGLKGSFTIPILGAEEPRGSAGGTPLVNGASQTGYDLNIDGCSVSTTNWLREGDWIQLGSGADSRLHKVMNDVDTNASGEATLTLMPKISEAPADNDPVIVTSAKGVFKLVKKENPISTTPDGRHRIGFTARENK